MFMLRGSCAPQLAIENNTMEFKRLLLALFLAFAAFHLWLLVAGHIWPIPPNETTTTQPAGEQQVVDSSSRPSTRPGTQPKTIDREKIIVDTGQAIIARVTSKNPLH